MASRVDERATAPPPVPPQPTHWLEHLLRVLPMLAFLLTFGVFFVHKNRAARSVFTSGRGLLTVAAIVVGYVVIAVLIRRWATWSWVAPVVLTAVVLALAAWIVRPYYVDQTADRRLVAGPVQDQSRPESGPGQTEPREPPGAAAQQAGPARLSTGAIRGIGHEASGTVSLIRNPDGGLVVRFENFDIEGTPDPRVYLAQGSDVRRPAGSELGRLQGNRGKVLDYAVAPGSGGGPGWTVLVWCRSFSVPIANAPQQAA